MLGPPYPLKPCGLLISPSVDIDIFLSADKAVCLTEEVKIFIHVRRNRRQFSLLINRMV
jgi:hypothetical protein